MHSCPCRRQKKHRFNPWVKKIPWRRKWPLTLVFLPGKSHGHRRLMGYSPWGQKELDMTEHIGIKHSKNILHICTHTHTHTSIYILFSQFSCSVVSSYLWPSGLQHARLPYPSPTPRVGSYSCPLSHWCHPTISSSVIPFSCCLQSFPELRSVLISRLFISGDLSNGVSVSASVLPVNIQDWFP